MPSHQKPEAADPSHRLAVEDRLTVLRDFAIRMFDPQTREAMESALGDLVELLEREQVPVLVLKGPALGRLLYRPDERRGYNDLDLFVSPDDRDRAEAALRQSGYENHSEPGVDDFTGAVHGQIWFREVLVDLHWRLAGFSATPQVVWTRLYETRAVMELGGRSMFVLGRPAMALHLATHAAQHGPSDRRTPADSKALGDLKRGLERWPLEDWRSAAELASAVGATEAMGAGLRLVPEGVKMATGLDLSSTASAELSWKIHNRRSRPRGTFHLEALLRAQNTRQRIDVLRRSLLPRPEWIARQYPAAAASRPQLVVGYARHLLRSPGLAIRAWQFRRNARRATR